MRRSGVEEQLSSIEAWAARLERQQQAGQCPIPDQLLDLLERRARQEQRQAWMTHLLSCEACRATYDELRELRAMQGGARHRWMQLLRWTPPLKWATPAAAALMFLVWLRLAVFHPMSVPASTLVFTDAVQPLLQDRPIEVGGKPSIAERLEHPRPVASAPAILGSQDRSSEKPTKPRGADGATPSLPHSSPKTRDLYQFALKEAANLSDWKPSKETIESHLKAALNLTAQLGSNGTRGGKKQPDYAAPQPHIQLVSITPEELADNLGIAPPQQPMELRFTVPAEMQSQPLVVRVDMESDDGATLPPPVEPIPLSPPDYMLSLALNWLPGAKYSIAVLTESGSEEQYRLSFRILSNKALEDIGKSEQELLERTRQNKEAAPLLCALVLLHELDRYGEALETLENARARYSTYAEFEELIEKLRVQVRERRAALRLPEKEPSDAP